MIVSNLLVGFPTVLLCLIVQVAVSFWGVRYYLRRLSHVAEGRQVRTGVEALLVITLAMMAGTVVQIAIWGGLFVLLGEFDELYEAIYHSAVNFASLGYGDIVMSKPWKLLGPLEAVNGVLMLGMTAAALMAILQQLMKAQREVLERR